ITDCNIVGNTASYDGGGMKVRWGCREISNCLVLGNTCGGDGGGMGVSLDSSIKNCAIIGNVAAGDGGGIYNWANKSVISNCTIVANTAGISGGGIYNWANTSAISNCTIVANTAGNSGGGVLNIYADSPLVNCILWANADSEGTGEFAQFQGPTRGVSYSCIQDDDPNDGYIPFGGEEYGNIDDNPMFVRDPNDGGDGWGDDPGTLDVNEGVNDDFGDLHLQSGSPCINAGSPFVWIKPNSVDIDGQPRV
ncbi:MAG: hypothetical protein ACYS21_19915, partial [Planctomycetota bacterium]